MSTTELCKRILAIDWTNASEVLELQKAAELQLSAESQKGFIKFNLQAALKSFIRKMSYSVHSEMAKVFDTAHGSFITDNFYLVRYNYNIDPQNAYDHEPVPSRYINLFNQFEQEDRRTTAYHISQKRVMFYKNIKVERVTVGKQAFSVKQLLEIAKLTGGYTLLTNDDQCKLASPARFVGDDTKSVGYLSALHVAPGATTPISYTEK